MWQVVKIFLTFGFLNGYLMLGTYPDQTKPKTEPVQAKNDLDISGLYFAAGKDSSGNEYECVVKISKHLAVWRVEWAFAGTPIIGAGILEGNDFAVGWKMPVTSPTGEMVIAGGCHRMVFSGDKAQGKWAVFPGPGKMMSEKWQLLR